MKLTLRIYLAVLASLLLFVLSILLLGIILGGYEKREYTQKVADIFQEEVLPKLDFSVSQLPTPVIEEMIAEREHHQRKGKHFTHHIEGDEDSRSDDDKHERDTHDSYDKTWLEHVLNNRDPTYRERLREKHHERFQRNDSLGGGKLHPTYDENPIKQIRQTWRKNRQVLREFTKEYHASVVILSPQGQPMRRVGRTPHGSMFQRFSNNRMVSVTLPHGLTAHIRTHNPNIAIESFALRFLIGLGVLFLCVGLISYPIARRISKRLNKLTDTVNHWGEHGRTQLNLDSSLTGGSDEIATLSKSFANASQRIDDLLEANKLLLANASHEIRTPLTRIRLNIEMLEHVIDTNKKADYLKRETAIKRNLAELDELVESILQSSRLDAQEGLVNSTSVDLYALVKQEAQHYPGLTLSGESVHVRGQENLMIQLVRNLIGNAYKHGKPPVSATVTTENGKIVFTVTDAGDGIPADKLEEIFTPFRRLSNNTKGNGLGLHLVKKIVELHGGQISVSSTTGNTCFAVYLNVINS